LKIQGKTKKSHIVSAQDQFKQSYLNEINKILIDEQVLKQPLQLNLINHYNNEHYGKEQEDILHYNNESRSIDYSYVCDVNKIIKINEYGNNINIFYKNIENSEELNAFGIVDLKGRRHAFNDVLAFKSKNNAMTILNLHNQFFKFHDLINLNNIKHKLNADFIDSSR